MSLQKKKNEKTSKQNVQRATFSKVNFSAIVFMLIEAVVEKNLLSHRGIPGGSRGSQIPGGSRKSKSQGVPRGCSKSQGVLRGCSKSQGVPGASCAELRGFHGRHGPPVP